MDEPWPPPDDPAHEAARPRRRGFDRVLDLAENFAGLLIWAMALGITTNVILRRTLNVEISWLFETTEYLLLVIAFIAGAALLRERGHVGVDLVGEVIFPQAKQRVIRIGDVLSAIILAVLSVASIYIAYRTSLTGQLTTGVVQIPRWWVYAVLPVGFSLMTVQAVRNALHGQPVRTSTE